jgi:serralysin
MALYGDTAGNLIDDEKGKNQHLILDDNIGGTAYGDADQMFGTSRGGNDHLIGGAGTTNYLYGDADVMHDQSQGGNDLLIGGNDATNFLYGDAAGFSSGDFSGDVSGGNDKLVGGDNSSNTLSGDADRIFGGTGGNDTLIGGSNADNRLYGDAVAHIVGDAAGGNDLLIGGQDSLNILVGDTDQLLSGRGGNDALVGAAGALNNLFGDSTSMSNAIGGSDLLIGAANSDNNLLVGDASRMFVDAIGGNDVLRGGDNTHNQLFGDAMTMGDSGPFFRGVNVGGNDTLVAGNGADTVNFLYGDAQFLYGQAQAGSDVLIGGTGTDFMYGDALQKTGLVTTAADAFVFAPNGGNDMIDDFRSSDGDRIDVRAWGFHSLGDMTISAVESGTHIAFDQNDGVTLSGIFDPATLQQSDFLFA